ncbi:glycosyltransferase [Novosphingobium panipatense]|uniref:glycosyltransferase n=1 Tax=Novosphingobium TaxID=165696 RepID=UPI001304F6F7|nr:glycosyltransferase [Novosphingobium sp. HII-3]
MRHLGKSITNRLLPRGLDTRLRSELQYRRLVQAFPTAARRHHGLAGELVVSLTSYPVRYATLHLTLKSLLRQQTVPDRIVLWIADGDVAALPRATRALFAQGIELRIVRDVRSYKKLVFALSAFPRAFIATADDDVFYPPEWLTALVEGQYGSEPVISCHRAHRLREQGPGALVPYHEWEWDVQDAEARDASVDLMPTGIGGVLYPPNALHPDAANQELFARYAPSADDLWFYWCARRAGTRHRKVGGLFDQTAWPSSQSERLYDQNRTDNDLQIAALVQDFGNPLRMPMAASREAVSVL